MDERSAAWLVDDLHKLGLRFSGVVAPFSAAGSAAERQTQANGLAVLYSRLG